MKKLLSGALLMALFLSGTNLVGQEGSERNFVIKTNPFASMGSGIWLLGIVPITAELPRVTFEYAKGHHGFMISGGYLGLTPILNIEGDDGIKANGVRMQGMYKYYPAGNGPKGFYLGPHASISYASIKDKADDNNSIEATQNLYSLALGYQFISDGGFSFDIYTGFGAKTYSWQQDGSDISGLEDISNSSRFQVPLGINFGYNF